MSMDSEDEENSTEDESRDSGNDDAPASVGLLPMDIGENEDKIASAPERIWFIFRCSETISLVFLWSVHGYYSSLVGTTMVDFQERLHTDYEKLGIVLTFRILGCMAGSLSAGVVRETLHVQSELILGVACIVCSLANFLKPWSPSVAFLTALTFGEGFFTCCLSSVGNAVLLNMWQDKASGPIHAFHFGFGFGALFGPIIAEGYLSIRCSGTNNTDPVFKTICDNLTDSAVPSRTDALFARRSRIEIPFAIAGGLMLGCSCVFVTFYLVQKFYIQSVVPPSIRSATTHGPLTKTSGRITPMHFLIKFIITYMFLLSCLSGTEGYFNTYLFTLAYESDLGFTKPESAFLSSAYWASFTASRFAFSVLAHFISVKILLFVEIFSTTSCVAGLVFLGFSSKTGLWVFSCFLGVLCAPLYPSIMSFIDRYIPVTGTILGMVDVAGGSVGAFNMWLAGWFVEHGQGKSFLYLSLSYGCFACILITVAQVYGSRHGDRHLSESVKFSRLKEDDDET